jgi:hypothetical protein
MLHNLFYPDVTKLDQDFTYIDRLYTHVSRVCFMYFIYFRHMLQVLRMNVSKVDLGSTCCNGTGGL